MLRSFASEDNLGTFTFRVVDVFEDLLDRRSIDEGAMRGSRIKTESEFEFGDLLLEEFRELVINCLMNK